MKFINGKISQIFIMCSFILPMTDAFTQCACCGLLFFYIKNLPLLWGEAGTYLITNNKEYSTTTSLRSVQSDPQQSSTLSQE